MVFGEICIFIFKITDARHLFFFRGFPDFIQGRLLSFEIRNFFFIDIVPTCICEKVVIQVRGWGGCPLLGVNPTLQFGGRGLGYQLSFVTASHVTPDPNGLVGMAGGCYGELMAAVAKGLGVFGPIDVLKLSFGLFFFLGFWVGYNLLDNLGNFLGERNFTF